MFLLALLLAYKLHSLENRSLAQNRTSIHLRHHSMPTSWAKPQSPPRLPREWILLGLCLVLMLYSISLIIRIFTQHNTKPLWMSAEWWSWD